MMEPHATIAAWEGDKLTVWTSNQMVDWGKGDLAKTLGHRAGQGPPRFALHRRRLRRQALPARRRAPGRAGRPGRGASREGGAARGRRCSTTPRTAPPPSSASASARTRTAKSPPSPTRAGPATCPAAAPRPRSTRRGCSMPARNRMTATRLAVLDLPEGNAMRAPGEAPGLMALEIAVDEMAERLGSTRSSSASLQRHAGRPGEAGAAVLAAPPRRVPAHRRRPLRLAQAPRRARHRPRRALARRATASRRRSATTS